MPSAAIQDGVWGLLASSGGQGIRQGLRMAERALDRDYPIAPDDRAFIISRAKDLADHENPRVSVLAMRVLLAADQLNVRREAIASREANPHGSTTVNVFGDISRYEALFSGVPPGTPGHTEHPDMVQGGTVPHVMANDPPVGSGPPAQMPAENQAEGEPVPSVDDVVVTVDTGVVVPPANDVTGGRWGVGDAVVAPRELDEIPGESGRRLVAKWRKKQGGS